MENTNAFNWRLALRYGLIAGIILLYIGVIGMLETFNEREIVRELFTLAQLLIVLPGLLGGYQVVQKLRNDNTAIPLAIAGALLAGVVVALPTIIALFIAEPINMRDVLVNVNRDWTTILTFDNRDNLVQGSLILLAVVTGSSVVGGLVAIVPEKLRRAFLYGILFTLLFGLFGDTLSQILQNLIPDEQLDAIFRRGTLKQEPALIIFALATLGSFFSVYARPMMAARADKVQGNQRRMVGLAGYALFLGLLLILPNIIGRSLSDVMVTVGLYVLMGLGLNIAIGLAGLLDLGYVTNYAVGAYIMAKLYSTSPIGLNTNGEVWSFWVIVPIALLAAMFTGFIFAVPVLKMRGDYLAIATLGFGEIIGKLAVSDWLSPTIGGAQGIQFIANPNFFGTQLKDPEQLYYLVLAACIVMLFVSIRLNNSRIGRQWMAIREDEDVAAAMGIDTARSKLLAFTISAGAGGVAGAIFAAKVSAVFPNSFLVFVSINVLSLIIVGGMGSNPGIVLGALALVGLPELLREFSEYRWLLYGALLIFMMLNRPEGLLPSKAQQRELHGEAAGGD